MDWANFNNSLDLDVADILPEVQHYEPADDDSIPRCQVCYETDEDLFNYGCCTYRFCMNCHHRWSAQGKHTCPGCRAIFATILPAQPTPTRQPPAAQPSLSPHTQPPIAIRPLLVSPALRINPSDELSNSSANDMPVVVEPTPAELAALLDDCQRELRAAEQALRATRLELNTSSQQQGKQQREMDSLTLENDRLKTQNHSMQVSAVTLP